MLMGSMSLFVWPVDPGGAGQFRRFGMFSDEPFGVGGVGRGEGGGAGLADRAGGVAVVNTERSVHPDAAMAVGPVVPVWIPP